MVGAPRGITLERNLQDTFLDCTIQNEGNTSELLKEMGKNRKLNFQNVPYLHWTWMVE